MSQLITKNLISSINLDQFKSVSNIDHSEFFQEPGQQHYKLLAYLSTLFNNTHIIDIGTHRGASSTALSYNKSNTIYTFDIENRIVDDGNSPKSNPNIVFNYVNIFDKPIRDEWKDRILSCPLIFLDIDPHDGFLEYEFYLFLKENNFQGLLVLDDIWYFQGMRNNFWYKIPKEDKLDITNLGHWSGSGIVQFPKVDHNLLFKFETLSNQINPTNPTLVTAYYDLTKMEDASAEINNRPKDHYLSTSYSTLNLEYDMVIYCEEDTLQKIKEIRPERLHSRTKFITTKFDDFAIGDVNFGTFRNQINQNRKDKPYHFDNRNTASYYLFCLSRYIMLKKTIETNYFNSEHFAWINICIERMGYKNLIHLDETFTNMRDKFSTCYIDYVSESLVRNVPEYYRFGRCSMCSGFFTGSKYYINEFCSKILNKFVEFTNMGYGHADEQLFSAVYFDNPEIFEFYYGDYFQMITNYKYTYDNPEITIKLLINKSFSDQKYNISLDSCRFLWNSYKNKTFNMSNELFREYINYYLKSIINSNEIDLSEIKNIKAELKLRNMNF
jgi:hypothetical protein